MSMLINPTLILGIIQNIALLIATSLLIDFFWNRQDKKTHLRDKVLTGIFVGVTGIVLMLTPWVMIPGLVFDTRSILIGISGLFFGNVPTIIAMLIDGTYRFILGGDGMWMGVAVILSSGTIGLLWRKFRPGWREGNRIAELLFLGLAVHLAMLICTVFLPSNKWEETFKNIVLPVILLYPIGTLMLGLLMYSRSQHWYIKRELFRSEEKFRQLFENTEAIMMLVEPSSGRILDVNRSAEKFYGYAKTELTKKYIQEINQLPEEKAAEARLKALKGVQSNFIFDHRLSNGNLRTVEVLSSPINFHGQTVLFSIIHDITEQKIAENSLILAKEKAEESDKLKSAFLAAMSHELRTPLNAIIGFSSLIEGGTRMTEITRYAEIIHNSGNHLLSIIESIFDVALLQSREYKIVASNFSVDELFRHLVDYANVEKKKKKKEHLSIRFNPYDNTSSPLIYTDRSKLMQLMTNLLNNAIKYTLSGGVEFGYTLHDRDIIFYVADTGIGVPVDKMDIIFEQFRQGDEYHDRAQDGVGLGLSICREIATLLGGHIWLESKHHEGSSFYFRLPEALLSEPVDNEALQQEIPIPDLTGKTILIVDDMEDNVYLLERLLSPSHAKILKADSGKSALIQAQHNPGINLVYMDLKMPGMDGYETAKQMLNIRPDLYIIAQTAHAIGNVKEKSMEAGCRGYIAKPIKRKELYRQLSEIFDGYK